jgi:hypothetical protein
MRHHHFALPCALAAGIWFNCIEQAVGQIKAPDRGDSPERLVQAALESEIGGPSALRKNHLVRALAIDPDFAPARWQAGFVRWRGQWHSPDEIAELASADKTLAEYRQLRDRMVDTADNHRVLAEWCRKHHLADETRAHWLKVLEFEPNDSGAYEALGLEWFDGHLLTRPQINQAKKEAKARQQAIRRFSPALAKWRSAIVGGSAKQRDEALDGLRELTDEAAVPAIGMTLEPNVASKRGLEFQLLLIEILGRMQHPEATSLLVRMSLLPDSMDLRSAAADQLKTRPMFAYVPQLIAAAPAKMKNRFEVLTRGDGQIICQEQIVLSGRDFDYTISHSALFAPIIADPAGLVLSPSAQQQLQGVATAELVGDQQSDAARQYQHWSDAVKSRIQFVLERTTGFKTVDDPQLWEKQWNDYYGWYTSPYSRDSRRTYSYETSQYSPNVLATWIPSYEPTRVPTPRPAPTSVPTPQLTRSPRPIFRTVASPIPLRPQSCFPAGTPVLTLTGPVSIETLRSGDRVLAQDLRTGELTYKTVHETTLRPATPLVSLSFGSEKIRATPGHPFWVVGAGWRVAKFLKAGDLVHGMNGATVIDAVEPVRPTEVYNLVVSDLHNYFVGQQRLLVHDNSVLEETTVRIPGLVAKVTAP